MLFPPVRELLGQGSCTSCLLLGPLQVEWENAELRGQLLGVTQERDSALRKSQGLQSKLESLEQVLKVRRLHGWGEGLGPRCEDKGGAGERAPCGAPGSEAQSWHHQPSLSLTSVSFITQGKHGVQGSHILDLQGWWSQAVALTQGLVFQHMREVAQRRQQLEVEHEQARLSLREKQEEVRRLQQVRAAGREGW